MKERNYYFRKCRGGTVDDYNSGKKIKKILGRVSPLPKEEIGNYFIMIEIPKNKINNFKKYQERLIKGKKLVDEIMSNPRKVLDRI